MILNKDEIKNFLEKNKDIPANICDDIYVDVGTFKNCGYKLNIFGVAPLVYNGEIDQYEQVEKYIEVELIDSITDQTLQVYIIVKDQNELIDKIEKDINDYELDNKEFTSYRQFLVEADFEEDEVESFITNKGIKLYILNDEMENRLVILDSARRFFTSYSTEIESVSEILDDITDYNLTDFSETDKVFNNQLDLINEFKNNGLDEEEIFELPSNETINVFRFIDNSIKYITIK